MPHYPATLIMDIQLELHVNGKTHSVRTDAATPLLYVLRNQLALNGPKYGCGVQLCGACMVLVDGKAEPSCVIPAASLANKTIITLEGLAQPDGTLHAVQQAFIKEQAAQCGYCLNGMVMAAVALLTEHPEPDESSIRASLQRSLCRCGTHSRIIRAVKTAAVNMHKTLAGSDL